MPTEPWKWTEKIPESHEDLIKRVFETPLSHLTIYFGNELTNEDKIEMVPEDEVLIAVSHMNHKAGRPRGSKNRPKKVRPPVIT